MAARGCATWRCDCWRQANARAGDQRRRFRRGGRRQSNSTLQIRDGNTPVLVAENHTHLTARHLAHGGPVFLIAEPAMHPDFVLREYCSLCHATRRPASVSAATRLHPEVIDVDNDPALVERFDELVLALMYGDTEIRHYHLDAARLDAVLAEIG